MLIALDKGQAGGSEKALLDADRKHVLSKLNT